MNLSAIRYTLIFDLRFNGSGYSEAWVAAIPEPTTLLLLGLGAAIAVRKQK
jgi:hypothetical protein